MLLLVSAGGGPGGLTFLFSIKSNVKSNTRFELCFFFVVDVTFIALPYEQEESLTTTYSAG